MAIDLGDPLPNLSVQTRNAAGQLENAGSVTLTLTLPDSTTTTPTVSNPSAGVYEATYVTVQAGRHLARWVATGLNASAYVDVYDVREAAPPYIVSVADAKTHLNVTSTDHDEELRGFIEAATSIVELKVGAVARRSLVETYDGGCSEIRLRHAPVISITTVKESGTTLATTSWVLRGSAHPRLMKVTGSFPVWFTWGISNIEVTYVVGQVVVSANATQAAKIIVQHLWETQRSADVRRPPTALAGQFVQASDEFGKTYSIPRKAIELLEPQMRYNFA